MTFTDEDKVDGDAGCARQCQVVGTEQHEVADDAEVAGSFQKDCRQHRAGRDAGPYPATKGRRTAGEGRRRGAGEAGPRAGTARVTGGGGGRCLEGARSRHLAVVDHDATPVVLGRRRRSVEYVVVVELVVQYGRLVGGCHGNGHLPPAANDSTAPPRSSDFIRHSACTQPDRILIHA